MTKVSIIIPVYNQYEYLREAIESIHSQTYIEHEIIVVNDGSTRNQDKIKEISTQHNIYYIEKDKEGRSAARNTGFLHSKGDYVVFLDSDDRILPNKLEVQARFLDNHPDIGIVYSDGLLFCTMNNGSEKTVRFSESGYLDKTLGFTPGCFEKLTFGNAFPIHAAMVRRTCLLESGLFDIQLETFEDWDLWLRLACRFNFAYIDALVAEYRVTGTNTSSDNEKMSKGYSTVIRRIADQEYSSIVNAEIRARYYYILGMIMLHQSRISEARSYFKIALDLNPQHLPSYFALLLSGIFGNYTSKLYRFKQSLLGVGETSKKQLKWSPSSQVDKIN